MLPSCGESELATRLPRSDCPLHRPGGWSVTRVFASSVRRSVCCPWLVMSRCVDGVELHRCLADIGDVVPGPGGHQHAPSIGHFLVEGKLILLWPHLDPAASAVEPEELIGIGVHFEANVASRWNGHQGQLQIVATPSHRTIVRIIDRLTLEIERMGRWADVCSLHDLSFH